MATTKVFFFPPLAAGGSGSNASVGPNGSPIPTSSTLVAGENPSGNQEPLQTDASGNLLVTLATSPVSNVNVNLVDVGGTAITLGSKTSSASLPVVVASDQGAIPVSQSGTWNLNNISGTISLPTGAATSANQTGGTQKTQIVDGSGNVIGSTANALNVNLSSSTPTLSQNLTEVGGAAIALGQTTMSASLPVAFASNQSTLPISAASLPLPTGASTSANQSTIISDITAIGTQLPATLGQKVSASSLAVVIASDQSAIPVSSSTSGTIIGNAPIQNAYTSTNITTSAYVQLVASTSNVINTVHIFDSSGQAMIFAIGGSGSEVIQLYVPPGGDTYALHIPAGSRIAYKALTATANAGYLLMSFLE